MSFCRLFVIFCVVTGHVRAVDRFSNGFPRAEWSSRSSAPIRNFAAKVDNSANEELVNEDDDSSPGARLHDLQSRSGEPTTAATTRRPMRATRRSSGLESALPGWMWRLGEWLGLPGFRRVREDADAVYLSNGTVEVRVPKHRIRKFEE